MEIEKKPRSNSNSNKVQEWMIFSLLGMLTLICGLVYAIQGPFYPIEARSKGISVTVIGFVYGIYELASFLVSPIVGSLMTKLGPAAGLHYGIILTGIGTVGLGVLGYVNDATTFVVLSVVFRITQALGATFRAIAVISMVTFTFKSKVATTFAAMESIFGIGMCVGVISAGALMEITGFKETFMISGSLLFLTLPVSAIILCKFDVTSKEATPSPDNVHKKSNIGLFTLMKVRAVALSVYALVSSSISLGFIMGVLEPHLKQFNLSPLMIGLMFLFPSFAYVIASPSLGYLYDKIKSTYYVQYVAPILLFISFSVIGPAPFIPTESSTSLTVFGLVLLGIAISSAFVSSFFIALQDGKKIGTSHDELRIRELISGIWRSAISLGLFLGPTLAGILYDAIGFKNASLVILALQITHIVLIAICGFFNAKPNSQAGLVVKL